MTLRSPTQQELDQLVAYLAKQEGADRWPEELWKPSLYENLRRSAIAVFEQCSYRPDEGLTTMVVLWHCDPGTRYVYVWVDGQLRAVPPSVTA